LGKEASVIEANVSKGSAQSNALGQRQTSAVGRPGWLRIGFAVGVTLIFVVVTVVFVLPFAWMILSSFKANADIFKDASPVTWKTFFPAHPTLANYISVFVNWDLGRNLANSLFVSVCQVVLSLIISSLAAYAFSRLRFPGRELVFGIVLISAMVPFEVMMVPLYIVVRSLAFQSSYAAIFLPWVASPFGIFLLRQAMLEVPRDYDDAAAVEGASPFQILWNVILPMIRPSLITLALMEFLWSWNAFLWPLIVMQDPKKQVIQVAIASFTLPFHLPAWGEIFAGACLATVPVLILFMALQRYYVKGVVMSGLK
jgi:ABC-type glycerol-3-phosphate transport system permease component